MGPHGSQALTRGVVVGNVVYAETSRGWVGYAGEFHTAGAFCTRSLADSLPELYDLGASVEIYPLVIRGKHAELLTEFYQVNAFRSSRYASARPESTPFQILTEFMSVLFESLSQSMSTDIHPAPKPAPASDQISPGEEYDDEHGDLLVRDATILAENLRVL